MSFLFLFLFGLPLLWFTVRLARPLLRIGAPKPMDAESILKEIAVAAGGDWIDDGVVQLERRGWRLLLAIRVADDDPDQLFPVVSVPGVGAEKGSRISVRPPIHAYVGDARDHLRVHSADTALVELWMGSKSIVDRLAQLLPHGLEAEVSLDEQGTLVAVLPQIPPYQEAVAAGLDLVLDLVHALSPRQLAAGEAESTTGDVET